MLLKRLRYRSYRNLECVEINPAPGFNIFWGKNGQGKTNLLEGIYLLGHLKSFRVSQTENLIQHEKDQACIESELQNDKVVHSIELRLQQQGKEIRLDGKRPQRISDTAVYLRQVLFSPEEVATVRGAPGLRRNLIDRAIFQVKPHYLEKMQNYFRVLKHRNKLLRDQSSDQELEIWSDKLQEEGAHIRASRNIFLAELKPYFEQSYQHLTAEKEVPQIDLRGNSSSDTAVQLEYLKTEFERLFAQEKMRRTTLTGPHRDDPRFMINQQELRAYGSQGQQRTFVLAFKVALMNLLKVKTGKKALLLLDDITSELDANRREALFALIQETAGQVFVTTTDPDLIIIRKNDDRQFYEVKNGQVYAS
ncbi:MAG: DNA replication/repair protein RecF [Desulfuromonas sp.]|nr:MAG: DNA replication/repair protein RecF [Desulfuromonas sp.]